MANSSSSSRSLLLVLVAAVLIIGVIYIMNLPDRRSGGEKIGDAVDTLSQGGGLKKAGRELEDRTPGERVGDAVHDAKDDIQRGNH